MKRWGVGAFAVEPARRAGGSGVDFIGPADIATGIPAAIDPSLTRDRVVARTGAWTAVALSRRVGERCVGR